MTTNVYFVLTADIALNGEWTPVHSFGGTFDGGNHTVSGMTIGTADAPPSWFLRASSMCWPTRPECMTCT